MKNVKIKVIGNIAIQIEKTTFGCKIYKTKIVTLRCHGKLKTGGVTLAKIKAVFVIINLQTDVNLALN